MAGEGNPPVVTTSKIRRVLAYWRVALGCLLTLLFCGPPFAGFMLIFVAPFVLVWLLISIGKRGLRANLPTMAIWLLTFAAIGGLHYSYAAEARANAESALMKINAYRARHGQYPASLEDSGFVGDREAGTRLRVLYALHDDKTPFLCHMDTQIVFDTYCYDFRSGKWEGRD